MKTSSRIAAKIPGLFYHVFHSSTELHTRAAFAGQLRQESYKYEGRVAGSKALDGAIYVTVGFPSLDLARAFVTKYYTDGGSSELEISAYCEDIHQA